MKRYSAERKESVIQKMMPPHNIPIPQLAEETGISDVTLKWSTEDKFAIVLEAAALNEAELAEYKIRVWSCNHASFVVVQT